MKRSKFLNIEVEGETNIGVISLGEFPENSDSLERSEQMRVVSQPKLKQALEEHFDADVEIKSFDIFSTLPPLEIVCQVSIEVDGELNVQEATLSETWVY